MTRLTITDSEGKEYALETDDFATDYECPAILAAELGAQLVQTHPSRLVPKLEGLAILRPRTITTEDGHVYQVEKTEIPVGADCVDYRRELGYLIFSTDEHGDTDGIAVAWYPTEPDDVDFHTGSFGGAVKRLSDGHWNWAGEWHETLGDAVVAFVEEMAEQEHEDGYSYYRVIGSGLVGDVARSGDAAWESFFQAGRRQYGYQRSDLGTAIAAHSACLIEATSRRAAEDADVSETYGTIDGGEWRRVARAG